jgi:hypothetical protein
MLQHPFGERFQDRDGGHQRPPVGVVELPEQA